jgi:plasmid stabilization system protein ParE
MTLKVVFRHAARAEFDAAALWYEKRQRGLGVQFVSEIDRAVELAANHPERFPIKHNEVRCVQVRRFPYSVFFRPETHRIVVLAVFHARRDPTIWQTRG